MRISLFIASILLICFSTIRAQDNTTNNPYFGQEPPGDSPVVFAPGIVSTEEFEFSGTFSKDGTEYFFTRRPTYEGNANRIFYSQLVDGKWTNPTLAPFAQNIFEFEPVMSADGNTLYFYSERKVNRDPRYDGDLWATKKTLTGWSEPEYFLSPVNKKWCMSVCPAMDGTLYFTSGYDGKRGIFKSENINGQYPEVEYLGEEINATYYSHPYIAPDESYMIMDDQPTGRGKPELFISFKKSDGLWTVPVNMGTTINATKTEFGASVSPDGKYLFFHRRLNGNGDIYWMDAKIIEELISVELK